MSDEVKSKIVQDFRYDKNVDCFGLKEPGEVDLVGKLFIRRKGNTKEMGDATLITGVLFGLNWNDQNNDEMWECEVIIKPVRKFKAPLSLGGLRIDQVLATEWGHTENYDEIK